MQFSSLFTVSALLISASSVMAQSDMVPPPPCLNKCLQQTPNCNTCTNAGQAVVRQCISAGCGFRDISYAGAYFGSVCGTNKGYMDFEASPHTFIAVPSIACPVPTNASTTATKREEKFFRFARN